MLPQSLAEAYHEATKYTYENVQQGHKLDWSKEPARQRLMPGAQRVELLGASTGKAKGPQSKALGTLGRLLYFTNGATCTLKGPKGSMRMRAAPSAGALYPTEIYVAANGHPALIDGIWNYQVDEHALALVAPGSVHDVISEACLEHPAVMQSQIAIILTGVFWRSAWRYKDRGYRRVLLDSGHVLGNLCLYAPIEGLSAVPIGGFADRTVAEQLLVALDEEMPLAVVPLLPLEGAHDVASLARRTLRSGPPLSAEDAPLTSSVFFGPGEGTRALHEEAELRGAQLDAAWPVLGEVPAEEALEDRYSLKSGTELDRAWRDVEGQERALIAQRRSCRKFQPEASVPLESLAAMLRYAYAVERRTDDRGPLFLEPGLLETYIAVTAVDGLESGVYYYAPRDHEMRSLSRIAPGEAGEGPSEPGGAGASLRGQLYYIGLFQELARDAAFTVFHVADLRRGVRRCGDRVYRYLGL
ncbi:MAG: SagB family peptide dehydrogenase, partial [Planctomycetota bacterium]